MQGRRTNNDVPRFVEVCKLLGCVGGMASAYSDAEMILVEADGHGAVHTSGFRDLSDAVSDPADYEVELSNDPSPVEPTLLPVSIDLFQLDNFGNAATLLCETLGGANAAACQLNASDFSSGSYPANGASIFVFNSKR